MSAFFGLIGFLALIVGLVMFIISLIRKKPKKKAGIIAGVGFVLFIIGMSLPSSDDIVERGEERRESEKTPVTSDDEEVAKKEQDDAEKLQKEEDKKLKEEEKKKAKEEKEKKKQEDKTKKENAAWIKNALPNFSGGDLTLNDISYDYIVENYDVFPALNDDTVAKAKDMTDTTINIKHLNKNATPHFEKILTAEGNVIDVEEDVTDDGKTVALIHIMDDDFNSHLVFLMKDTGDILEDDRVQIWGAPVGPYSFENVSGGFTNSQVYFGSHIEKR